MEASVIFAIFTFSWVFLLNYAFLLCDDVTAKMLLQEAVMEDRREPADQWEAFYDREEQKGTVGFREQEFRIRIEGTGKKIKGTLELGDRLHEIEMDRFLPGREFRKKQAETGWWIDDES